MPRLILDFSKSPDAMVFSGRRQTAAEPRHSRDIAFAGFRDPAPVDCPDQIDPRQAEFRSFRRNDQITLKGVARAA